MRLTIFALLSTFVSLSIAARSPKHGTRILAGIEVPDTPLITKAIEYARVNLDPVAWNHIMRTWLIGQASISSLPKAARKHVDLEAYALSALLHDLGFSQNPEIITPDRRFEVDGANAARAFIVKEGGKEWDKHRIQLVWDAIALHTSVDIVLFKESEAQYVAASTNTDLLGIEIGKAAAGDLVAVTQEQVNAINKEFPRTGLRQGVFDTIVGFCVTKPNTTYENFMGGFGEELLDGYNSTGKRVVDLMLAFLKE